MPDLEKDTSDHDGDPPTDCDEDAESVATVSSDESDVSIFGLRSIAYSSDGSWSECDQSLISDNSDDIDTDTEKQLVANWRETRQLQYDRDFAFIYTTFDEAYAEAGRAVSTAWSRCRQRAELSLHTDASHILAFKATSEKIKACEEAKKKIQQRIRGPMRSRPLRNPGQGTQPAECDADKERFKQQLIDIMKLGECHKRNNSKASDQEYNDSIERKVLKICRNAEIPTLQKAVTTCNDLNDWIEARADGTTFTDIQPLVLESFVFNSKAQTRVITSLKWLRNNLGLNFPLDDMNQPTVGRSSGVLGLDAKQTPAAQPLMVNHLENEMRRLYEKDDPTWPALLGSWLQAAACLRLSHIISRSAPVERFPGWILFFCKRGKQKHNRKGFYWGVPDMTSDGWDWATAFLALYDKKRRSRQGSSLMGAIFRADDFEHFTPRAVNIITQAAMQQVIENPHLLGTYSWRRYLPTMALKVKSSPEERLALGDWQDNELLKATAPITLRYADGKDGLSRQIKTKLSKVQEIIRDQGVLSFDELSEPEWKDVVDEASKNCGPMSVECLWRNADVEEQVKSFTPKKPKRSITMPKVIGNIHLATNSRSGTKRARTEVSGVVSACTPVPAKKRRSPPQQHSGRAEKPRPSPNHHAQAVANSSIMDALMPELSAKRQHHMGIRINPEKPTMVAKVCRHGGELWLGALPTRDRLDDITSGGSRPIHIQICCLKAHPTEVSIDGSDRRSSHGSVLEEGANRGVVIPNAELFKLEMSNHNARQRDIRRLRTTLVTSLRQGDNAYVHCVTGLARAPTAACILVSLLMDEDVASATRRIAKLRNVQLYDKNTAKMRGDWMDRIVGETCIVHQDSNFYLANTKKTALVHAGVTSQRGSGTSKQPLCKWKRVVTPPARPDNRLEVLTAEEAKHFSNAFCQECLSRVSASRRTHINDTFYPPRSL